MRFFTLAALAVSGASAAIVPSKVIRHADSAQDIEARDASCTNSPTTRQCWSNGYSVATDFDTKWPTTGVTRYYKWTITNTTCNPDGHGSRICLLINNQYPGPLLTADWGDMINVQITNQMQNNGTTIHWHGMRQYNTPGADGVPGVTQCPIAPGVTYNYTFQATQYGSSWYHSHYTSQYGDGVVGPMYINGPASANYDVDLGPAVLTDWYYQTAFQVNAIAQQNLQGPQPGPPPNASNVLINGANKDAQGHGHYTQFNVTSGKKFRLRVICATVDNFFQFSIDNHTMQVIANDYVPVYPVNVNWLTLGAGQRYDIVISANQTVGNYWIRTVAVPLCGSHNNGYGRAILAYSGAGSATPAEHPFPAPSGACPSLFATPYWSVDVPSSNFNNTADQLDVGFTAETVFPGSGALVVWAINGSGMVVDWEEPVFTYIMDHNTSNLPVHENAISEVAEGSWNYWIVQQTIETPPIAHPIHLHGHDFYVIGTGQGNFNLSTANLTWNCPNRRDTATLPANGWLALAWEADSPGAWLMHCHIAWHISEGFGVQFLEDVSGIVLPDAASYNATCASWDKYYSSTLYKQTDSGI